MSSSKKLLQAAAGSAGGAGLNIEDVFSTYLYEGNGSTQTITNGIDLSGEGGLVWLKRRSASESHYLYDTERGIRKALRSDTTAAQSTLSLGLDTFNSDGFRLNVSHTDSGVDFATWTFRKAPKFFDVVTYTGTGSAQNISHNLGTTPAVVIVKMTSNIGGWFVYHSSVGATKYLRLETTGAELTNSTIWNNTAPTDTQFTVGTSGGVNQSGGTYVAYLFAHNDGDGEFGPDGDADIIKCGSYTGNGSTDGPEIDLGFEPQWVLVKQSSAAGQWWQLIDVMRGFDVATGAQTLGANASDAEYTNAGFGSSTPILSPTATGFQVRSNQPATNGSGSNYIYIAIRRGPMAVPTDATDVYKTIAYSGTSAARHLDTGFVTDLEIIQSRNSAETWEPSFRTRLTSTGNRTLNSSATAAEYNWGTPVDTELNTYQHGTSREGAYFNASGYNLVSHQFSRAPSFFDVVAYTGNGTAGRTVSHNLGVAPEMIWVKARNKIDDWPVFHKDVPNTQYLKLNGTNAAITASTVWNNTSPTETDFTVGTYTGINGSSYNYIAYLFASVDGVSKVFSVTKSSGSDASVNCGFSAGPRFVLLKRTDSTGDWYVWDSERGIVAGNDPYLLLNSTAAEVTSTDYIDPTSNGFTIVNGGLADGDYIGYAVA